MHTPTHQEVGHQFQEAIRSWTQTDNKAETPGNRRDLHLLAVSPGQPSVNSSPRSAKPSLLNSKMNICAALIPMMNGKGWRRKFRTRWNVPHTVGAIDRKHIAMKKLMKTASNYYSYKGFFFLALLALVYAEYRFLWID